VELPRNIEIEKSNILVLNIIKEIRNIRAENSILPDKTI
jgi:hypothetical protein